MTQMVHVGCMCQPSYAFVDVSSCFSDIPAISMVRLIHSQPYSFLWPFSNFDFKGLAISMLSAYFG